jgi:hypothetical protein
MLIQIDVTNDDIKSGCRGMSFSCPIALASKRALKGILEFDRISVYRRMEFYNLQMDKLSVLNTPESAFDWLANYDANNDVREFSFELNIPDSII